MNMKTLSILFVLSAFLYTSCSSGNSNQGYTTTTQPTAATSPEQNFDNSLPKGKIVDSVVCQSQNTQSFALYLPTNYSANKKFPCIYLYDSHARGALPVRLYKNLAEKYGFILIASNNSKNGLEWPETNQVIKVLMDDTRHRINIDPQRIYTAGFSGGARVASSIAIYQGGIAGVIGCAAGFPTLQNGLPTKFDYFGLIGDYDFNLTEMEKLDETLEQNGFAHQLLTFDGKHDWPSSSEFQTALLWIQTNAMKENIQPKNDTLITNLKNDYEKRIATAKASGDVIREHELLDGLVRLMDGLSDASSYKKQLADLNADTDYKSAVTLQTQIEQEEQNEQQTLGQQFIQQDEKWWDRKIAFLYQNVKTAKTRQESQMNQRLLNFLGLVAYINSDHALNENNLTNAPTYLRLYKLVDPENPDCSYLTAVYNMKKGDSKQAISSLNEAASLGYSDVSKLTTDPVFNSLHGNTGFDGIVAIIKANNSK